MNETTFSILLFILGLIIGVILLLIINYIKNKQKEKKADSIIDHAKKEADKINSPGEFNKIKRTSLLIDSSITLL